MPTSAHRAGAVSAVIGAVTAVTGAVTAMTGAVTAEVGTVSSVVGDVTPSCVAAGAAPAVTTVAAWTSEIAVRHVSRPPVSFRQYGRDLALAPAHASASPYGAFHTSARIVPFTRRGPALTLRAPPSLVRLARR